MTKFEAFPDQKICVIGLGYVGLTLAVAMADTGFLVAGVERRRDVVETLLKRKAHFWEPRLDQKLDRVMSRDHLKIFEKPPADFDADVYIITVGTPLGPDGSARIDMAANAAEEVAQTMNGGALVILRSTVKLGTARNVVAPILDRSTKPYHLAVCPERTLEGRALLELNELPQIIGADDHTARRRCQMLFNRMTPTTVALSSLEAAELVKLVDNTFRDVSFGFANEVAKLCGQAGLSAAEVIRAGKLGYPRTNVPMPGPVGGPCLEKDPHILIESAQQFGVEMPVTHAARMTNEIQPKQIASMACDAMDAIKGFTSRPNISLLGLAFKGSPATDDLRGSMAFPIYAALKEAFPDARFKGYDPVVPKDVAEKAFGFEAAHSLDDAFTGADVAFLLTNHTELQNLDLATATLKMSKPALVYDMWNMHDVRMDTLPPDVHFIALGREKIALGRETVAVA